MMSPLTWLYAPATRPELMSKALTAGADMVIYDLEDAVLAHRKSEARGLLDDHLTALADATTAGHPPPCPVSVRVNALGSGHEPADLAMVAASDVPTAVRVPKVTRPEDVDQVAEALGTAGKHLEVHVLVESAAGIENLPRIASHPRVAAVSLGEADLSADLGVDDESGLSYARSRLVSAARAAGLPAPAMAVYTDVSDPDGLAASCREGRRLGLLGRGAIHPNQLPVIRDAFRPSDAAVRKASEVVSAAEEAERDGSGAFVLASGAFVDEPVVLAARRTLELAQRLRSA